MRVTFILPGYFGYPIGGVKIVYEYANFLVAKGHEVFIVHPRRLEPQTSIGQVVKARLWPYKIRSGHKPILPWFPIDSRVQLLLVPDLREKFIPRADAIFASAWETANPVYTYSETKGRKFYLIQHYETWAGPAAEVDATWRLPMHKVVMARWLQEIANSFGESDRTSYIPYGMDLCQFRLSNPISERTKSVALLNHPIAWKGTQDGLEALELVRSKVPDVEVVLFGVVPRDATVPEWAEYIHKPSPDVLVETYNRCSIFMQASWTEGWGLTASEAMACGCALVTTENGGAREYAIDDTTALVAAIKSPKVLASQLLRLLLDEPLRQRIANAGHDYVQQFTWDRAGGSLETLLLSRR